MDSVLFAVGLFVFLGWFCFGVHVRAKGGEY